MGHNDRRGHYKHVAHCSIGHRSSEKLERLSLLVRNPFFESDFELRVLFDEIFFAIFR